MSNITFALHAAFWLGVVYLVLVGAFLHHHRRRHMRLEKRIAALEFQLDRMLDGTVQLANAVSRVVDMTGKLNEQDAKTIAALKAIEEHLSNDA